MNVAADRTRAIGVGSSTMGRLRVWLQAALALGLLLGALASWSSTAAAAVVCADYPHPAAVQAAYRFNPTGVSRLDADNDGIARERNPGARDLAPVDR